jgi:hypothetical protein
MRKPVFTDFLDKPGQYTPTTREPIRSGPVQGPQKPTVADKIAPKLSAQELEQRAKAQKERAALKTKKVLKPVRIGKDVYDYEFTGWDAMSPSQKTRAINEARADIIANDPTADKKAPNRYDAGAPVSEGEALATNLTAVGNTLLDPLVRPARTAMKSAGIDGENLQKFGERLEFSTDPKDFATSGPFAAVEGVGRFLLNSPGQLAASVGAMTNPKTDNIGFAQAGTETMLSALGGGQAAKAGIKSFKAFREAGQGLAKSAAKGVGTAVMDSLGVNSPDVPVSPKPTPDVPSFQQFREGAKGADVPDDAFYEDFYGGGNVSKTQQVPQPETMPKAETPAAPVMNDMAPNTTGISNAANLDDVENGLLTEIAKGEGKSASAVYEANRTREDYLEVAKRVRDGQALNADDTAALLAGKQKLAKRVFDTREAVKSAIANGVDESTLRNLQKQYDDAIKTSDDFAQDVQRGKSEWSNVGRVLAKKVEVNTGDIAQVAEEARLQRGRELTDAEYEKLRKTVEERNTTIATQQSEINALTERLLTAEEATRVTRKAGMSRVQTSSVRQQARTRFVEAKAKAKAVVSMNALQGITDPDVIKAFKEYVNAIVDDGARGLDDVLKQLAKEGVDADAEDIYKAFTDRTGMRKLSDLQRDLAQARRELKKEVAQKVIQGPKKAKDVVQGPDLPGAQRLRDKIAELDNQIKTGQYIEKQPKVKREIDAEIYRLQQIAKMKDNMVKQAIRDMKPRSNADIATGISSNLKLMNPWSRLKDIASNTITFGATAAETLPRYAVDALTAKLTGEPMIVSLRGNKELLAIAKNRVKSAIGTDIKSAWKGLDADATEKFGWARGIGGKAAGVTDAPFKTVYREYANVRLADMKARKILGNKATPGDIANMRDTILANLDDYPDVKLGAEDYALFKTFNNKNAISKFNAMAKTHIGDNAAGFAYEELISRFSKVITNVNLDRLDRVGFGIVRGFSTLIKKKGMLSSAERMMVNDMIAKGMTGMPLVITGYLMSDKIPAEIKEGYRKYIDRGDLGELGGVVSAFFYGADMKAAEKLGNEANDFRTTQTIKLATDNPMSTNISDAFGLLKDPTLSGIVDFTAKKVTNMIPGGIRDVAKRMDEPSFPGVPSILTPMTGKAKEREKYPKGTKAKVDRLSLDEMGAKAILDMIVGETKSKLPYFRQTLPEK